MPPLVRFLVFALCATAGYFAAGAFTTSAPPPPAQAADPVPPARIEVAPGPSTSSAESRLIAEWQELKAEHGSTAAEMPALFTTVKAIKDAFRRRAFRAALLAEWAALDPQGAITFLSEKDRANIGQLMREWLRLDPQAAVTGLLAGGEKTRSTLRGLLGDIARHAPSRLAEVVAALPKSESRWDTTTQDAFVLFAKKDSHAARAAAESVTGALRGQALAGVAKVWGEQNGPEALAWAQAMPEGEARDAALKAVLTGWATTNPAAALERIDVVPPGGEEMYHASDVGAQVLREAAKKDWEGTLRWLREHPGKLGRSSLDGLQSALSQRLASDPTGTLESLAQGGTPGLEMVFANSVLNEGYAKRDVIWEWLDTQPASDFTRSTRGSLLNAIAWKEPVKALEFLEKLPDSPENRQLLEQGTRSLINGGSQINRLDELLGKASPKIRPLLLQVGFEFGLQNGAGDPAKWVGRLDELPVERRPNAVAGLARGWAVSDPQRAIEWAQSLSDATQRTQAFDAATGTWASTDIYETSAWVNSLPAGGDRDTATRNLVGALSTNEPETAWNWALSIGSPADRMRALQLAYMSMQKKDPAIAQQLLESANLPAAEAKALREHFHR